MSKKFSNFKRIMTMFLIVVMLVGMLPMTALASDTGGSTGETGSGNRGDDPPSGSGGRDEHNYDHDEGRFTRYTLVRFEFSDNTEATIPASDWANKGKVVGSIDVLTDGSVPAGTKYFKTNSGLLSNAFSYRKGDEGVKLVDGYSVDGQKCVNLFGDLPGYPTSHKYQTLRYTSGDGDPLMYRLGGENPDAHSNVPMWAPNSTFNRIIELIVASSSNPDGIKELKDTTYYSPANFKIYNGNDIVYASTLPASEAENFKYSYNFIASAVNNGTCYRLLAEPGVITNIPVGMDGVRGNDEAAKAVPAAVTLRDIASVLLTEENAITKGNSYFGRSNKEYEGEMAYVGIHVIPTEHKYSWLGNGAILNYDKNPGIHAFWFIVKNFFTLQRHAYGLYNINNAFRTYVFSQDNEGNITDVVFNTTPDSEAFFRSVSPDMVKECFGTGGWNWNDSTRYKYSCYSIAQYILSIYKHGDGMLGWGEGRGTGLAGHNIPVYKEGAYPAMGLGIIEPGSMITTITNTDDTIRIKKIIGYGLDKNEKWEFKLSVPALNYNNVCNADMGVSIVNEDGSPVSFTEEAGNMVYSFELGNEESRTFKVINIPDSLADTVRENLVWTIEEVKAKELLDANEGIEDENQRFSVAINGAPDDDGIIDGVQLGTTTVFKNQKGVPEGNLHLIVDYNIPGAAATTAPNNISGNIVDCGGAAPGECLDVDLMVNGQKLIPGSGGGTGTVIEPATGVKFKFVGLSTKPDGISTDGVNNNGVLSHKSENTYTYQMPTSRTPSADGSTDVEDNLLVLYVIWELEVTPPDTPTPTPTPTPSPSPGGEWYTVYWVLNYDGGGITSQTCGKITIPAFTIGCGHCGMSGQRPAFTLSYGFDPPYIHSSLSSYREGHYFAGWIPSGPQKTELCWETFQGSCPVVESFEMDDAIMYIDYSKTSMVAGKTTSVVSKGFPWITGRTPDSPVTVVPEDPGENKTYYAVWVAERYSFNANGGHFKNMPEKYDDVSTGWEEILADEAYGPLIESVTDTHITYKRHHIGVGWRVYAIPQCEPVREGYTFKGWYYDKACTVPLDLTEEGVFPMRTYYAGWEADPVYVTYYDTREGTTEVATQVYSYDDYLDRLAPMESTIGWSFSDWVKNGESVADRTRLDTNILECHDTRYGDKAPVVGVVDDHDSNSIGNQGAGVMSHRHFWTLDLTATWNQETADYSATFHFNDYNNNDGARPVKITVGIVDSITNREVTSTEINLPEKGWDTVEEFTTTVATGLAMTNNNVSTERVKYYMYLKDYTDIDGQTFTIQNTSASSGEIALASRSNADTSPMASYRYTINQVNTGNVTDQPNIDGGNDGLYTGVMYFDHNLMTTGDDVKFTIRWNDQSDNDGMRPETLKLTLIGRTKGGTWVPVQDWVSTSNGQLHQSNTGVVYINSGICDVSDDGNVWTYIFKDFQKYDNGEYIEYAIKVEGYEEYSYKASVTGYVEDGVTLTYEPVKAPVPVDIYWHDNANQDGMRPSSVVVDLVAHQWNRDLGAYESVVVSSKRFINFGTTSNVWSNSFDNMPVYHDGQPIIYHLVVASDLNGNMDDDSNPYTWSEGIAGNPYKDGARPSVDIYHNADERSVTATVQWDDNGNQDGKRPDSVTLQLYANNEPVPGDEYTVVLTGDPKALTWTYTFEHLDVYTEGRSGKEIVYKVKILDAQGGEFESYTPSYINKNGQFVETFGASGEAFVLMSYKPKTGTVSGAVYWQDDNNRDGQRPDFVTVALHASAFDNSTGEWIDYVAATKTVRSDDVNTMTADQWRFEFENMPVYRGSQPITYYITITSDLNGNTDDTALLYGWGEKDRGDMASDPELEVSVTVYQGVETISVTATVEWDDDNNNDGLRPNAVQLQLYADLLYT